MTGPDQGYPGVPLSLRGKFFKIKRLVDFYFIW